MTLTTVSAWFLALTQIPVGYRGEFIGATLILLASAMFAIAMTCRKNESDSLDYENNMLLDALGPTFVVAAFIVAVSTVGFLAFVVYSILTF